MRDAMGLYLRYLAISIRSQMQHRASFVMLSIGHFLSNGIEFLAIWALFSRFGSLKGWSLAEVSLFYGIINIAFALAEGITRGFDTFADMVRTGGFDRVLLRPRSTALQIAGRECQLLRIGRLLQGSIVLVWAASSLGVAWTIPRLLLTIGAILGGACLFSGLFVLQATLCFWTTESLEIVNTMTYGGVNSAQYPLTIYRAWFRRLFTFVVPLASVTYFPALAVLGRTDPLGSSRLFQSMAPAIGVVFMIVCLQIWRIGVLHYHSTGS